MPKPAGERLHNRPGFQSIAAMKIGVISDTHDFLDPRISVLFRGVEHILHGGDIGMRSILAQLEKIAPVTAVMGNTDDPAMQYRLTEIITLAERKFLVHHIVNPHALEESLAATIDRERPHVVVFGHTHKPFSERVGSTLFFNPGYAGKSRFGMERTVAILHCTQKGIRLEYLPL
jgi:putative phosphoesterase